MTRTLKQLYIAIGTFGILHIALGLFTSTENEIARLWFVGSGLAIILISILGLSGVHRLENSLVVSTSWALGNLCGFLFVGYATWILPEPQNLALFIVFFATVALSTLAIRQSVSNGHARWCCTEKSAT